MSNNRKRLQVYLEPDEYKQLKEWSDETGKSMSEIARTGIMEYTDQDRLLRIEEKLDEVHSLVENSEHTHTTENDVRDGVDTTTSETVERMREIVERLQSESTGDGVVKETAVKQAIEDIAGGHDKTLSKYKDMVRERGLLFEHPGQPPLWTVDVDGWIDWMSDYVQLNGTDEGERFAEIYPANIHTSMDGKIQIEASEDIKQ